MRGMPKGIVNDEMSRETPISSRVSKCRGSVALDDVDENAKIITGMYFLKNFKGLDLVKIKSMTG